MWADWLKFQADAKAERVEQERLQTIEKVRKQKKTQQMIEYTVAGIISAIIIGASIWVMFYLIMEYGGAK